MVECFRCNKTIGEHDGVKDYVIPTETCCEYCDCWRNPEWETRRKSAIEIAVKRMVSADPFSGYVSKGDRFQGRSGHLYHVRPGDMIQLGMSYCVVERFERDQKWSHKLMTYFRTNGNSIRASSISSTANMGCILKKMLPGDGTASSNY